MKPHHTHDCTACTYLGSATLNEGSPIDFYVCRKSLVYRHSSEPPDYGSTHIESVSSLSIEGMIAFGMYLRHLGVNGANGSYLSGSFFTEGKLVLQLPAER